MNFLQQKNKEKELFLEKRRCFIGFEDGATNALDFMNDFGAKEKEEEVKKDTSENLNNLKDKVEKPEEKITLADRMREATKDPEKATALYNTFYGEKATAGEQTGTTSDIESIFSKAETSAGMGIGTFLDGIINLYAKDPGLLSPENTKGEITQKDLHDIYFNNKTINSGITEANFDQEIGIPMLNNLKEAEKIKDAIDPARLEEIKTELRDQKIWVDVDEEATAGLQNDEISVRYKSLNPFAYPRQALKVKVVKEEGEEGKNMYQIDVKGAEKSNLVDAEGLAKILKNENNDSEEVQKSEKKVVKVGGEMMALDLFKEEKDGKFLHLFDNVRIAESAIDGMYIENKDIIKQAIRHLLSKKDNLTNYFKATENGEVIFVKKGLSELLENSNQYMSRERSDNMSMGFGSSGTKIYKQEINNAVDEITFS